MFLSIFIVQVIGKFDKNVLFFFEKDQLEGDVDSGLLSLIEIEKLVVVMWIKVLKIRYVDIEESFFDLGG